MTEPIVSIVCPFWGRQGHAGLPRVERFARWLNARGIQVIVVAAGSAWRVEHSPLLTVIHVRDPLGIYRDATELEGSGPRKPNRLRRLVSYLLFVPDPTVVWARSLARNRALLDALRGTTHVISSNPPESVHIGGAVLARRLDADFVMDMRDGWLDEPLRPLLAESKLRQLLEGVQERRCVHSASLVLVTSDAWRELLARRIPNAAYKIATITNAYPRIVSDDPDAQTQCSISLNSRKALVHGGRFIGSDPRRRVSQLVLPLLSAVPSEDGAGWEVRLYGTHAPNDLAEIEELRPRLELRGWQLKGLKPVARRKLLHILHHAAGLLLLTTSRSQIPGKLFEYLPAGRPILAVAPRDSETWRVCEGIEQVFLVDIDNSEHWSEVVSGFLRASGESNSFEAPGAYSDGEVGLRFLSALGLNPMDDAEGAPRHSEPATYSSGRVDAESNASGGG